MAQILYGAPVREQIKKTLLGRVKDLGRNPVLAIVTVGDRADTSIYLKNKQKFGSEIGVSVEVYKFSENINEEELSKQVVSLNENKDVDAIIVQLPLPNHINTSRIINLVSTSKDADGLADSDLEGSNIITPATARGVLALLNFYNISVENKKVVVIGRSKLAGGPISSSLEKKGAKVTVCHKGTDQVLMPKICMEADILISAAGQPMLVSKDFVHSNQVVIDVGINRIGGEVSKIVGDVDFVSVEQNVHAITPVPGGVGLLTVACLFENVLDLCYSQHVQ